MTTFAERFMPHGMCYLWDPRMLALQIGSDAVTAIAYFSIPILLLYFINKRRDVPFSGTIAMFGLFIVACGLTHVMAIYTIWHPAYWLDGGLKAFAAVISLATAVMLVPLVPKALTLRTPAALERLNSELERDLEVRRKAHAETESQYRSLAEALPHLVWTAEADGSLDYGNARWLEYTGMPSETMLGWAWTTIVHARDVVVCTTAWHRALETKSPFEVEYRLRRADGAYRWHLIRAQPIFDASHAISRWFGTCTDIDDQKHAFEAAGRLEEQMRVNAVLKDDIAARSRAEAALRASDERFRQVEENAPIGLALVDLDGSFIRVNPALCAIVGLTKEELLERSFPSLLHPDDVVADAATPIVSIESSLVRKPSERRYIHADGHVVWALLNVSTVRDDEGAPCYYIAQIQDITARIEAESKILSAQRAVQAAAEAKTRFLATMSHEIRTPMNGIIGMAELLALSELTDDQTDCVRVVRDSGQSLLRVLNDILDYSKIEAGKLTFSIEDFDLRDELRSIRDLLGSQFSAKNVALTIDVADAVPPLFAGDDGRIRQILINLIANALKFTPPGGDVTVTIAETSHPAGGPGALRFAVTDTGVGIHPALQDRLFQPFSQIDGSTTREYGGTGLGLSICKQLVHLMGGEIGVDSTPGVGSTFWFTLPVLASTRNEHALDAPLGTPALPASARPERILLAEDNVINTRVAIRQFTRLGFAVTAVANGREAVDAVANGTYDIIFMDCHMPEMDGYDATRAIRELPCQRRVRVPIVAMTANAQAGDPDVCLAAGMDDYVSKPATLADLGRVLQRWLPLLAEATP